jgi:polyribonucleotide nucleotidyltransferase
MTHTVELRVGEETLTLQTGRLAKQANGAVYAQYAGSAVLATVCCSAKEIEGLDYVPLQVEYNEKAYASGKIPGSIFRREGRPRDREILVCRLIDRPLRPLFHQSFSRDIQVVPTVVSADQVNPPDVLAIVAASAAVTVSDVPFEGPVAGVRVALLDGTIVVNPTHDQIETSELDIVVAGTRDGITMVEGGAMEADEATMISCIERAHEVIAEICDAQLQLAELGGRPKLPLPDGQIPETESEISAWVRPKIEEACFVKGKEARYAAIRQVKKDTFEHFGDRITDADREQIEALLEKLETDVVRTSILDHRVRTDGRSPDDIRDVTCEVDVLPRAHGAALFTRGETQALAVTTLGTANDELRVLDALETDVDRKKRFMLHYNFPPFSVGETGRLGTGRREVGHGHLAERALERVIPSKEEFPYTLRVVSETLESNGSSSMASVCGGTLSLLNAGVPIMRSVAGIAMGLISDGDRFVVLSDILGEEDHLGDMDFKVAGTEQGITAFQMDIKIAGVSSELLREALDKARVGRLQILEIMRQTMDRPRGAVSDFAPKIITMRIDVDKIGAVIGTGGSNIRSITESTGADVNIEDDGVVTIYCRRKEGAERAQRLVEQAVEEPEVGKTYTARVMRIMDFGAFMEILPGKEGLCHISRLTADHVGQVEDVVKVGDEVQVKLIEIDRMGRLNLATLDAVGPDVEDSGGAPGSRPVGDPLRDRVGGGRRPGPGRRERFGPDRRDGRDSRPPRSRNTSGGPGGPGRRGRPDDQQPSD